MMRNLASVACVLLFGCLSTLSQVAPPPPPVADNANLENRSLKDRSVEMERARRDESKSVASGKSGEAMSAAKFNEIKEDFEQIQLTQTAIVAAYRTANKIDYKLISTGAEQIGSRGERLKGNLFQPVAPKGDEKKKKDKDKAKVPETQPEAKTLPTDIKSLIAEMDNTLGVFVSNPMFSNAKAVTAADHARAQTDLEYLIALSKALQTLSTAQNASN